MFSRGTTLSGPRRTVFSFSFSWDTLLSVKLCHNQRFRTIMPKISRQTSESKSDVVGRGFHLYAEICKSEAMTVEADFIGSFKISAWLVQGKCCLKMLENFGLIFFWYSR